MAKFVHADVLDGGLNAIKNGATHMLLLKAYTAGDSYATVITNLLADVAMAPADFVLSSSGNNRLITTASGKSATSSASSGVGPNLHLAFTDGTSKVLWVTDETSDQVITSGNPVNFPQLTYTSNQPT